jgi:hypothetical protein
MSLEAVADDATATVCARRGKRLDGAFKAIECMRVTGLGDLKGFIVLVAAGFTACHRNPLPLMVETLRSYSVLALSNGMLRRDSRMNFATNIFHAIRPPSWQTL